MREHNVQCYVHDENDRCTRCILLETEHLSQCVALRIESCNGFSVKVKFKRLLVSVITLETKITLAKRVWYEKSHVISSGHFQLLIQFSPAPSSILISQFENF